MRRGVRALVSLGVVAALATAGAIGGAGPANAVDPAAPKGTFVNGFDVSNFQTDVDFAKEEASGAKFVFIKSGDVESLSSTPYTKNAAFASQWADAGTAGLLRGIYVVAGPGNGTAASDPKKSADYFIQHVGAQLRGPNVLPPVVDLEAGQTTQCWMSSDAAWRADLAANQKRMVAWIQAFSAEVKAHVTRVPMIYTTPGWWNFCTGGSSAFAANRLFIANWTANPAPTLPSGWSAYAFWQWRADSASGFAGDQDVFHGSTAALQALAATPLSPTPTPTVTGGTGVGQTLTAHPGTWGPSGVALSYQWYIDGSRAISGATRPSYAPTSGLIGHPISVRVTGTKAGYATTTTTSAQTAPVGILTAPKPTVTGTLKVGSTLSAHPGTWGPGTVALKYQWYLLGKPIGGANKQTYTLSAGTRNRTLTVKVTGTRTGFRSVTVESAVTGTVK